jgi:hypothetical protein
MMRLRQPSYDSGNCTAHPCKLPPMKTATVAVLLLLVAKSLSCDHASPVDSRSSVVPVELVVARPQSYAHQLVTVRGCYFHGYEVSALGSCHDTGGGACHLG